MRKHFLFDGLLLGTKKPLPKAEERDASLLARLEIKLLLRLRVLFSVSDGVSAREREKNSLNIHARAVGKKRPPVDVRVCVGDGLD